MKKTLQIVSVALVLGAFSSCSELFDNLNSGLSEEKVVEGLKTALELGTDTATSKLKVTNGYYGFADVKIPLPPAYDMMMANINEIKGNAVLSNAVGDLLFDAFDAQVEQVVLGVNRAAEDAAVGAGGIFVSAITDMSISEGWDILNGIVPGATKSSSDFDSTAATTFLAMQTRTELIANFSAPMDASLNKKLIGSYSANQLWTNATSKYNQIVGLVAAVPLVGKDYETVDTDLSGFVVGKALDGFFLRIGQEEVQIRRDPFAWSIDIIQEVFGSITQ